MNVQNLNVWFGKPNKKWFGFQTFWTLNIAVKGSDFGHCLKSELNCLDFRHDPVGYTNRLLFGKLSIWTLLDCLLHPVFQILGISSDRCIEIFFT